jgi:hypothetical protein
MKLMSAYSRSTSVGDAEHENRIDAGGERALGPAVDVAGGGVAGDEEPVIAEKTAASAAFAFAVVYASPNVVQLGTEPIVFVAGDVVGAVDGDLIRRGSGRLRRLVGLGLRVHQRGRRCRQPVQHCSGDCLSPSAWLNHEAPCIGESQLAARLPKAARR